MTLDELSATVAALSIEVTRGQAMIQALSESHDQNRRELQAATTRATDLTGQLEQQLARAEMLLRELAQLKATR